jgi:hypothetical protein
MPTQAHAVNVLVGDFLASVHGARVDKAVQRGGMACEGYSDTLSLVRAPPAQLVALFGQLQVEEAHRNMIIEGLSRQRTCHAALSQPRIAPTEAGWWHISGGGGEGGGGSEWHRGKKVLSRPGYREPTKAARN